MRRFLRIAPLFYVMVVAWIVFRGDMPSVKKLILNVTFLFGFDKGQFASLVPAGWSIGVEMIFYALLPVLFLWVGDQRRALIGLAAALLLGYAFHEVLPTSTKQMDIWFARMNFITNAANFMGGLWAYFFYRSVAGEEPSRKQRLSIWFLSGALGIWLLTAVLGPVTNPYVHRYIVSAGFPFLILTLVLVPWRVLVNRVTTWTGKVSYSIYLTHVLVIVSLEPLRKHLHGIFLESVYVPMAISIVAIGALVMAVSAVTFAFIEQPGMRLGRSRWMAFLNRRTSGVTSG